MKKRSLRGPASEHALEHASALTRAVNSAKQGRCDLAMYALGNAAAHRDSLPLHKDHSKQWVNAHAVVMRWCRVEPRR
jgi:hypothetical protein